MKKRQHFKRILILLCCSFSLQSCFLDCSYHEKIEFDNSRKVVKVLSENYCIISIKLTEYEPMEGYIREIENNTVKIDFDKNKLVKNIELPELLNVKENDFNQALIDKKYIEYEIVLEEIEPRKHSEDTKYIQFVSEQVDKGEKIFESEGCK
jgi:hypothetical protein